MNFGEYQIQRELGSGSFGQVFLARKGEKTYALKVEHIRSGTKLCLSTEYEILKEVQDCPYFPKVYKLVRISGASFMVMQVLGLSLASIVKETNRSLDFALWWQAWQHGLLALKALHEKGYLHRDVKPGNFATDQTGTHTILFDLGLGKSYLHPFSHTHIPYDESYSLAGTLLFSSLNVMSGVIHSRRDDLESLMLTLIYLRNGGKLPWSGIKDVNKSMKMYRVQQTVIDLPIEKLCGRAPPQLVESMKYIRGLGFEQEPDYDYLSKLAEACVAPVVPLFQLSFDVLPSKMDVSNLSKSGSSPRKTIKKRKVKRSRTQTRPAVSSVDDTIIVKWTYMKIRPSTRLRIQQTCSRGGSND